MTVLPFPDMNGGELISEHCDHLRRRALAESTIYVRRTKLERLAEHVPLLAATAIDIDAFLDLRDLSAKTRYSWVSNLHQFYAWAIDWGHADRDPTVRVIRPRQRRQIPRPIDTGDLVVALQMADPTMRAWLSLMAFAGFRCVEVARLEVDDLLWSDGSIRVHGKGDKDRLVPMHADVERALRSIVTPRRGRVFRRPRGGGYPPAQVSREVSLYLDGLDISATAHQLRHWFGTQCYRGSRDLRVVQELMGHQSPTTTAGYADWSRAEAAAAVRSLSIDSDPSLLSDWVA